MEDQGRRGIQLGTPTLSTGKAAKLCGVTPDTILRWIKSGRLEAHRTAGGHHRIRLRDLDPFIQDGRPEQPVSPSTASRHCWEFMSGSAEVREECRDCIVYQSRAEWCFRLAEVEREFGHKRLFCESSCEECDYYRQVGRLVRVLAISQDEELISRLEEGLRKPLELRFARNAYEASGMIERFRPALVVLDSAMPGVDHSDLLDSLSTDARVPGLRVILAVRGGATLGRPSWYAHPIVAAVLEKPFGMHCVEAVIARVSLGTRPEAQEDSTGR